MPLDLLRKTKLAGFTFALLSLSSPYLFSEAYVGVFGGGGNAYKVDVSQYGFAFRDPDVTQALHVLAEGKSGHFNSAMVGAHVGYDFSLGKYLLPAIEFEGFYLRACSGKETDFLINATFLEHAFVDTLPLRSFSFFGNVLLALHLPCVKWLEPYVGGGIGGAAMWISHAFSEQDSPAEPGINHFNSKSSASDGAFTVQFKTGLRFNVHKHWRLFIEYRFLHVASTSYNFGFTQYPSIEHVPTSNWMLHLKELNYNLGTIGVEYKF